jgi:hypothetical protein
MAFNGTLINYNGDSQVSKKDGWGQWGGIQSPLMMGLS